MKMKMINIEKKKNEKHENWKNWKKCENENKWKNLKKWKKKKMVAITPFLPGDISRYVPLCRNIRGRHWNSSWTRDVNGPMAFTEIYLKYRYEIL
jgi:hypothetical protein